MTVRIKQRKNFKSSWKLYKHREKKNKRIEQELETGQKYGD